MKPVVIVLATAILTGASACSSDDSAERAAPAVTVTTTQTVSASVEPSEPEVTDYYGMTLKEVESLLECETVRDMTNDAGYKRILSPYQSAGLCVTDNGTHRSAVLIFEDEAQQEEAEAGDYFSQFTSGGALLAPGMVIGCIDESVCSQFGPLIEEK